MFLVTGRPLGVDIPLSALIVPLCIFVAIWVTNRFHVKDIVGEKDGTCRSPLKHLNIQDPDPLSSNARFYSTELRSAHYTGPDLRNCDLW